MDIQNIEMERSLDGEPEEKKDNISNKEPEENEKEYNSNFDAGVGADEDENPKKYIQQLTGKLSQSLRKYNENLPHPEVDLNKYVAGMILKQAIEGLTNVEKKEILDKVKMDKDEPSDDGSVTNDNDEVTNENIDYGKLVDNIFEELTR